MKDIIGPAARLARHCHGGGKNMEDAAPAWLVAGGGFNGKQEDIMLLAELIRIARIGRLRLAAQRIENGCKALRVLPSAEAILMDESWPRIRRSKR